MPFGSNQWTVEGDRRYSLLSHAAGEIISTVQMVMQAQMPYTVLRDRVLTHPTMTEGLNLLFSKL
ncbi:hypothetical protein [Calothrix sp. NIES-2098]|uniref:hypothetical protein n=1 Tax=Calothrix sp. NIES-2098 TaxID=1954171 RepID=UPI0030DC89CD